MCGPVAASAPRRALPAGSVQQAHRRAGRRSGYRTAPLQGPTAASKASENAHAGIEPRGAGEVTGQCADDPSAFVYFPGVPGQARHFYRNADPPRLHLFPERRSTDRLPVPHGRLQAGLLPWGASHRLASSPAVTIPADVHCPAKPAAQLRRPRRATSGGTGLQPVGFRGCAACWSAGFSRHLLGSADFSRHLLGSADFSRHLLGSADFSLHLQAARTSCPRRPLARIA